MDDFLTNFDFSRLPGHLSTLLFVYFFIVRDIDKRLNGLSSYIKRFLALYQASVKARKASTDAMLQLTAAVRSCNNYANDEKPLV